MALTIYSIAAIIMILQKRINTNIGFYTYIKERYNGILDKYERIMQSCNVDPMTLEIANIVENNELEIICDNDTYYISNYEVKCAFLETILRKETGWLQEGNNKRCYFNRNQRSVERLL